MLRIGDQRKKIRVIMKYIYRINYTWKREDRKGTGFIDIQLNYCLPLIYKNRTECLILEQQIKRIENYIIRKNSHDEVKVINYILKGMK